MIVLALSVFLWAIVATLAWRAWRKGPDVMKEGLREGAYDFLALLPRLAVGVVGSGFLAALLPADLVRTWLGADSGIGGILIATIAGALTPGGPVVGFALGSTALKSGAGLVPVVAYATAWALYAFQRLFIWELPFMPAKLVWLRVAASLPLPILAAYGFVLVSGRW